jgi:VIT1/CCC1 family predicted Fe2+/Mn2+ transporter
MTPTTSNSTDLQHLFIPDVQADDTPLSFIEEVGTLIFQSALMQFIVGLEKEESDAFEVFIEEHVSHESFIEEVCAAYPDFEKILDAQMRAFQSEIIFQ